MMLKQDTSLKERRKNRTRHKLKESNRNYYKRIYFMVSNKHMYAQFIDDHSGKTLTAASTLDATIRKANGSLKNRENVQKLADLFYKKVSPLIKKKESLVFDRGSNLYHGKVKVFAENLREKGLNF